MEAILSLDLILYFICYNSVPISVDMPNTAGLTIYQLRDRWKDLLQLPPYTTWSNLLESPSNIPDEPPTNTLVWPLKHLALHLLHPLLLLAPSLVLSSNSLTLSVLLLPLVSSCLLTTATRDKKNTYRYHSDLCLPCASPVPYKCIYTNTVLVSLLFHNNCADFVKSEITIGMTNINSRIHRTPFYLFPPMCGMHYNVETKHFISSICTAHPTVCNEWKIKV